MAPPAVIEPFSSRFSSTVAALAATGPYPVRGDGALSVRGISYDSRTINPGDLFVALRGGYADGHDFLGVAQAQGAVALLVDRPVESPLTQIIAPDTRAALARVAAEHMGRPAQSMKVVGVTGTDGKTTTTCMLDHILRVEGRTTGLVGTVSVRIGDDVVDHETRQTTPESLDTQTYLARMRAEGVQVAILECTSHGLALHRLDGIPFAAAGVTNITHEHLEYHGTIAAYRRAKGILFDRVVRPDGSAVINLHDEGARQMLDHAEGTQVITYSPSGGAADLSAADVRVDVQSTRCLVMNRGRRIPLAMPLLGAFNVENALCSIGLAEALGVASDAAIDALASMPPIPGRMASVDVGQPFTVIVDYAHTPESLQRVLRLVRELNPAGEIIVVFGSAGERDVQKRSIQGAVAAREANFSIFTSEDPRGEQPIAIIDDIANGAIAAGAIEGDDFLRVIDRREAIAAAFDRAKPGDCVLLAGKGHEQSIIVGKEKVPWDEATVARELLSRWR